MYCEMCGKSIPDDSVFCPECGGKIAGSVMQDEDQSASGIPEEQIRDVVNTKDRGDLQKQNNTPTIVMVLGIVSIAATCITIGFIPAIVALVMGFLDIKQNGRNGKTTAGLICAVIALALTVAYIVFLIVFRDDIFA